MNKVIVAGSINMDIVATSARIPVVGETVEGSSLSYFPGGKGANQAVASAKQGAPTSLISKVGGDPFGVDLIEFLKKQNVCTKNISLENEATSGTALITVSDDGGNVIVVVPGANSLLMPADIQDITISSNDILVSQFEIPLETITEFFRNGKDAGATTILNPAPAKQIPNELKSLIDILVVNETELAFLSENVDIPANVSDVSHYVRQLNMNDEQIVIVTLGSEGVVTIGKDVVSSVKGHSVNAVDSTGAGDCFVGCLAAKLSEGESIEESVRISNAAAALSVTRNGAGTSMPSKEEVFNFIHE